MDLKGKFFINGKIEVKTGLHIGGSKETLDIGGVDAQVIRTKDRVYIPGSSLKGKIRSLLEQKDGRFKKDKNNTLVKKDENEGSPCECGKCGVCKIFGPHKSENIEEPVRIIIRDADCENKEIATETKMENIIDRVKGTAISPRSIERVTAGTMFDFEIIFNVYKDEDIGLINKFIEGMDLLEDDYLGGSGSRGYGEIEFRDIALKYRPKKYYEGVESAEKSMKDIKDINALKESLKNKKSVEEIITIK